MCRDAALSVAGIMGMTYNPLTRIYALGADTDVNYILHARNSGLQPRPSASDQSRSSSTSTAPFADTAPDLARALNIDACRARPLTVAESSDASRHIAPARAGCSRPASA